MAAAISGTTGGASYLSSVRPFRRDDGQEQHRVWRLPPNHIADLCDVARGVEETDAGVCCKYLVDSMSGAGSDFDEVALEAAENFCEQNHIWKHGLIISWRDRILRCRRTVQRMRMEGQHKHVNVLFIVYGYPDPLTRDMSKKTLDSLGELASLARYTDAVEVKRQEMARLEAVRTSQRAESNPEEGPEPESWLHKVMIENAFEDVQRGAAIRQGLRAEYGPGLVDLMRHRERYQHALKILSSSDALRSQLLIPSEREDQENGDHFQERKHNAEVKRDLFLVQVKIESSKMLEAASRAYHAAWLKCAV